MYTNCANSYLLTGRVTAPVYYPMTATRCAEDTENIECESTPQVSIQDQPEHCGCIELAEHMESARRGDGE